MTSFTRSALLLAAVLALGCGGATSSQPIPVTNGATHPAGVLTTSIAGFTGRPFGVRISSRDLVYATQQDANSVASFTLGGLTPGASIPVGADPGDVVFSPDGNTAYVSAFNAGTIHVLDVRSNVQTATIPVSSNAYRLQLSLDGGQLYVSSTTGRVFVVHTADRTMQSVQLSAPIQGLALSASGQFLFAAGVNGQLWKLDAGTLAILATGALNGTAQDIALSRDGTRAYVALETRAGASGGAVSVVNTESMTESARANLPALEPFGLMATPDDAQLYVTSPSTGEVAILDAATLSVVKTLFVKGTPRRIAFNQAGSTAVVANEANWVDVIR